MRLLLASEAAANVRRSRDGVSGVTDTRRDHLYAILDDHALRPGMSPLFEDGIFFYAAFETRDEALLGFRLIGSQQQGEQIEVFHFCRKQRAEFNVRRVHACISHPVSIYMHHIHVTAYALRLRYSCPRVSDGSWQRCLRAGKMPTLTPTSGERSLRRKT